MFTNGMELITIEKDINQYWSSENALLVVWKRIGKKRLEKILLWSVYE